MFLCILDPLISQAYAPLFCCTVGQGLRLSEVRTAKVNAPLRELKAVRCLHSIWPLWLCYRGVVYHGAKWQHWRLANLEGTMKEFWQFRRSKASTALRRLTISGSSGAARLLPKTLRPCVPSRQLCTRVPPPTSRLGGSTTGLRRKITYDLWLPGHPMRSCLSGCFIQM